MIAGEFPHELKRVFDAYESQGNPWGLPAGERGDWARDLDVTQVRARYGLDGGPWMLTVARLVPHKGMDVALEVLGRLAARHPDLRYAIAGDGPDRERLARCAAEHGVADRVQFLGLVPEELLPPLYAAAAVQWSGTAIRGSMV